MADETLPALRDKLSALDTQLLAIVAERTTLSLKIGRIKRELGRGTRDFAREKVVLDRAAALAEQLGLSSAFVEKLTLHLIEASLSVQEQDRIAHTGSGQGKRALIIGGAGKMGRWFVTFLAAQGYTIEVADPNPGPEDAPQVTDWRDTDLQHDLIVVAAPLQAANDILLDLAKAPPPGVVFDIGSLKSPVRTGLLALHEAGGRVTSLHPMFGPNTSLLSGKHVLFVDVGNAEATETVRELFEATMAEQADMDLDTHDRLIAVVLGLSHATNLAFNAALAASGEALPLLAKISSTTFDSQLGVSSRVSQENPHLYFEIQALNDYGTTSLDALHKAVAEIRDLVTRGDEAGFVDLMERGRAYLCTRAPAR